MTAPLREVLVHRPDPAFGAAFDNPAHGFRHPVDLELAHAEHDAYTDLLAELGVRVHRLVVRTTDPDLVYTFDPALMTDAGAVLLRPGKTNRQAEPRIVRDWLKGAGVPIAGRIGPRATIEGGDVLWLRPNLVCVGISLRTNAEGARQLAAIVDAEVRVFDLPYWRGDDELVHLLSVISPITDNLAVVYPPLLPVGLWTLLRELKIKTIAVPDEEFPTLGLQRPRRPPRCRDHGRGQPGHPRRPRISRLQVHTYPATEVGLNGSGGPTCMAFPIRRD